MGFGGASAAQIEELIQTAHTVTDGKVDDVEGKVDDVQAQTDKLAGEAPSESSVTANWQSGTATSGETGADLVNIGTAADRKKLHSLLVDISQLTIGAVITIKLFMTINAVSRKVYPPDGTTWVVGTDPGGIWVVNGTLEITGVLRVEVESNTAGDNTKAIAYKYDLEDM